MFFGRKTSLWRSSSKGRVLKKELQDQDEHNFW
jgi:hypothetical protein